MGEQNQMLILNRDQVAQSLSMSEAISVNREAFEVLAKGNAIVPDRLILDVGNKGSTLVKPAYIPNNGLGLKV
jgi:ornithine cyclodeaminase/alanine dehydrogenase-like protein (mu-crystallin family)